MDDDVAGRVTHQQRCERRRSGGVTESRAGHRVSNEGSIEQNVGIWPTRRPTQSSFLTARGVSLKSFDCFCGTSCSTPQKPNIPFCPLVDYAAEDWPNDRCTRNRCRRRLRELRELRGCAFLQTPMVFWTTWLCFSPIAIGVLVTGDVYYMKKGTVRAFGDAPHHKARCCSAST
jgi:hypothetical protein